MTGLRLVFAVLAVVAVPAAAQSLSDRVAGVGDGAARFSFTARPGVCGNGRNIMTIRSTDEWISVCDPGPVRVVVTVRAGEVVTLRTYVGGRWREAGPAVVDLGFVAAPAAAEFLLALVRTAPGRAAERAVLPAALADSVTIWPELLAVARDAARPRAVRKSAVFWLGQAAGDAAASGLEGLIDAESGDIEVKEQAIFALSQLPRDEGVPRLIRLARSNPDPRLRKKAIFWLAQSSDPQALELFEELLTRR